MDRQAVEELNADLAEFTDDVFGYLAYPGQRGYGRQYLRGLMLDGARRSPTAPNSRSPWTCSTISASGARPRRWSSRQ